MVPKALCSHLFSLNPEYCEFAKDHYTKVAENKLLEKLSKKKRLSSKVFKEIAEEHQCCPFELQLDAAQDMDTVICDYNYVFAPRSTFGRLASSGLISEGKPNLVIDEAHNLPSRAMDYYSPSLSVVTLEKMRADLHLIPLSYRRQVDDLFDDCINVVKSSAPKNISAPMKIAAPGDDFLAQDAELRTFLSGYLSSDVDIQPGDPMMRLCFYWSEFTAALQYMSGDHPEFFTTYHPNPASIRITCCDASEMLKDCYKEYAQVVGFSATLKPFAYYSQMSGLNVENLKTGNYIAFFPSFDFMERVANLFVPPSDFRVLKQERHMKRDEIDEALEMLKEPGSAYVLFAVQGGVFSEGVDYAGDMVIGAFFVGPPLPNFGLER